MNHNRYLQSTFFLLLFIISTYSYAERLRVTVNNNCNSVEIKRTLGALFSGNCDAVADLNEKGKRDFYTNSECTYEIIPGLGRGIKVTFTKAEELYAYISCHRPQGTKVCECKQQARP